MIAAPRYDMYRLIHKALRVCMAEALAAVGRMDPEDDGERKAALAQVGEMLGYCQSHLKKEDAFVHPAMEARAPGSSGQTSGDHTSHVHWFRDLETAVVAVEQAEHETKAAAAAALYLSLALFVGENFVHMHAEETTNNEVLWRTYSDPELIAIEQAIVASLSPQEKAFSLRWMLPVLTPAERAQMLRAMRPAMPAEAFAGILATLRPWLSDVNWWKLTATFDAPGLAV